MVPICVVHDHVPTALLTAVFATTWIAVNTPGPFTKDHCWAISKLHHLYLLMCCPFGMQAVALAGVQGADEKRRRLRAELMRWHPDKFAARFGRLLHDGWAAQITAQVNQTSQVLNGLNAPATH